MKIPNPITEKNLNGMNLQHAIDYIIRSGANFYLDDKQTIALLRKCGFNFHECFEAASLINGGKSKVKNVGNGSRQ